MRQFIVVIGISSLALSKELSLSLEDAINIAINSSLELSIANEQIFLAKEREKQTKREFLPKLNLKIEIEREKIKPQEEFLINFLGQNIKISQESSLLWKNKILLNAKQMLYSGGELSNKIRLSKALREYLEYENEIIKQNLVLSVIKAYWELKYSQYYFNFCKKKVDIIKTLLEITRKKKEMGEIKESKLMEEEIRKDCAEYELAIAMNEQNIALNVLLSLLNIKEGLNLIDDPKIEPLNITLEELIAKALENNFKIKQLEKRIEEKKCYIALAKSIKYPHVDMEFFSNYSGNKDKYKDAWSDLKFSNWEIVLTINLPIYSGGIIQSKIKEAEADLKIARNEYFKVKNEVVSKIKEIFLELKRKENQYKIQENILSLAKEQLKLKEAQYTLGNIAKEEMLQSQMLLDEATLNLFKVKVDYEIAKEELFNFISVGTFSPSNSEKSALNLK